MAEVGFACRCGAVSGVLSDATPQNVCHLICYCRDCRAFARHLGLADALEPGGGSPLVQVLPARIRIDMGSDNIGCLRLSEKGLNRWYATCCNTPLANSPRTSKVPIAGMWRAGFESVDAFGPVTVQGFTKSALPGQGAPRRDKGLFGMLGGLVSRWISAAIAGTSRQSPFFEPDGAPVATPKVLTGTERKAAYAE